MKINACLISTLITVNYLFAQETTTRLNELDVLIGSWEVTAESRLAADGPWETNQGKSIFTKTTGASLIEEDFSGNLKKKPFLTKTIIAFNHFSNKFQRIFIDSEHGALVDYEGEKNANQLVFDKDWVYPNKSTVKLRVVYTFISKDEFTVENMRMPQNASGWDTTGRMRFKWID